MCLFPPQEGGTVYDRKWCNVMVCIMDLYDFSMQALPTLVVHDRLSQGFLRLFTWRIDRQPKKKKMLHFELQSSNWICSLKIDHCLLCEDRRGPLRKNTTFLESCKLLIICTYFSIEFEYLALRVGKSCTLFLWSKLWGVASHMLPFVPPLYSHYLVHFLPRW